MINTYLVTGGAGYIGSHAVKRLLAGGHRVVVFDNLSRGWKGAISKLQQLGEVEFIQGDLSNVDDINSAMAGRQFAAVFHFAALCSVNESMENPGLYFENNVLGTLNLLEAMAASDNRNLIFSSTCAIYGNAQYLPIDEKHPINPENPYGESKAMAERVIHWYGKLFGIHYVILRYFNVCGADSKGFIGDSKKPSLLLLQNAVRGALGIEPFSVTCQTVDTEDGTPIRDYVDVEDLISGHISAAEYLASGGENEIVNLGNGAGWSVLEIINQVEKILDTKIHIAEGGEKRRGEYAKVYADTNKAKQLIDWRPKKNLSDSVNSLAKWYRENPNGYER